MNETPDIKERLGNVSGDVENGAPAYYYHDSDRRRSVVDIVKSPQFAAFSVSFILIFVLYIWVGVSIKNLQVSIYMFSIFIRFFFVIYSSIN